MPQKMIFLLLLIVAAVSWASPELDALKKLETIQRQVKDPQKAHQACCDNTTTRESVPADFNSCISDICGAPDTNQTYLSEYQKRLTLMTLAPGANDPVSTLPEDIRKQFENRSKSESESFDLNLSYVREALKSERLSANSEFAWVHGFIEMAAGVKELALKPKADGSSGYEVDLQAMAAKSSSLSAEQAKRVYELYLEFAAASEGLPDNSLIEKLPPAQVLKTVTGESDTKRGARAILEKWTALTQATNTTPAKTILFEMLLHLSEVDPIAAKIASSNDDLTEDELRTLLDKWHSIEVFSKLSDPKKSPKLSTPGEDATLAAALNKFGGSDFALLQVKSAGEKTLTQELEDQRQCAQQYRINSWVLPSESKKTEILEDVSKLKRDVVSLLKSKYSAQTSAHLAGVVGKLDIVAPPTLAEFNAAWLKELEVKKNNNRKSNDVAENLDSNAKAQLGLLYLAQMDSFLKVSKNKNYLCDNYMYQPLSDANYKGYGSVLLSFSLGHASAVSRRAVIAHEIGHSVFNELNDPNGISNGNISTKSAQHQIKVGACISSQHSNNDKNEPPNAIQGPASRFFSNEDFADTIAMNVQNTDRNPWCFLMVSEAGPPKAYSSKSFRHPEPVTDTHSTDAFRLLNYQSGHGIVFPDSCQMLLKQPGAPVYRACLDQVPE